MTTIEDSHSQTLAMESSLENVTSGDRFALVLTVTPEVNVSDMTSTSSLGILGNKTENVSGVFTENNLDREDLISSHIQYYIDLGVAIPICSLLSLMGIISNVICILVFLRQGFKNSVSVSTFSLAVSDLGISISTLTATISYCIHAYVVEMADGLLSPHYVTGAWVRGCFYGVSSWITLFFSLERCLCIVLPFRVKHILSRERTMVIIIIIYVICFLFFFPAFVAQGLSRYLPAHLKTGDVVCWFLSKRILLQNIASTFAGIFTPTVCQISMFVTTYIMTSAMYRSLEFRHGNASVTYMGQKVASVSRKDLTLIRVINVISIIFIACNFPVMVFVYGRRFVPGLDFGGHLKNLHATLLWMTFICGTLNSSVNLFVYLKVASSFRDEFFSMLRVCCNNGHSPTHGSRSTGRSYIVSENAPPSSDHATANSNNAA